jgi:hypothetical protein
MQEQTGELKLILKILIRSYKFTQKLILLCQQMYKLLIIISNPMFFKRVYPCSPEVLFKIRFCFQ